MNADIAASTPPRRFDGMALLHIAGTDAGELEYRLMAGNVVLFAETVPLRGNAQVKLAGYEWAVLGPLVSRPRGTCAPGELDFRGLVVPGDDEWPVLQVRREEFRIRGQATKAARDRAPDGTSLGIAFGGRESRDSPKEMAELNKALDLLERGFRSPGRKSGTGEWASEADYRAALRLALRTLRGRRPNKRPTVQAVTDYFRQELNLDKCIERRIYEWNRTFGVDFQAEVDAILRD